MSSHVKRKLSELGSQSKLQARKVVSKQHLTRLPIPLNRPDGLLKQGCVMKGLAGGFAKSREGGR